MVDPLTVGSAPQAGPDLRLFTIICLNPDDLASPDMGLQHTPAAAVMETTRGHYGRIFFSDGDCFPVIISLLPFYGQFRLILKRKDLGQAIFTLFSFIHPPTE
jgi:hypothetical protein